MTVNIEFWICQTLVTQSVMEGQQHHSHLVARGNADWPQTDQITVVSQDLQGFYKLVLFMNIHNL